MLLSQVHPYPFAQLFVVLRAGGPFGNSAECVSCTAYLFARRTTTFSPSSSHSITEPGRIPSRLRTSAGTEICPCAESLD
jgi:hypothetical protein